MAQQLSDSDLIKMNKKARKEAGDLRNISTSISRAPNGSIQYSVNSKFKSDGKTPYADNDTVMKAQSRFLSSVENQLKQKGVTVDKGGWVSNSRNDSNGVRWSEGLIYTNESKSSGGGGSAKNTRSNLTARAGATLTTSVRKKNKQRGNKGK